MKSAGIMRVSERGFDKGIRFHICPVFAILNANKKPAAYSRCENEMGAKTGNRQIIPCEGLGNCNPQRDGRRKEISFWSFRIRWPYLALEMSQKLFWKNRLRVVAIDIPQIGVSEGREILPIEK